MSDNNQKILFVDLYGALAHATGTVHLPMQGREIDWQYVMAKWLDVELKFTPVPDAEAILDRAELEKGFEIVFISERPNIQQMEPIAWLDENGLLVKTQRREPGQRMSYDYGSGRRRYEFRPVKDLEIASDLWKASIVGAALADQVHYIGGQAVRELLAKQVPAVKTYASLAEFDKSLSPLEAFFKPRRNQEVI